MHTNASELRELAEGLRADARLLDTYATRLDDQAAMLRAREGVADWCPEALVPQTQSCTTAATDLRRAADALDEHARTLSRTGDGDRGSEAC